MLRDLRHLPTAPHKHQCLLLSFHRSIPQVHHPPLHLCPRKPLDQLDHQIALAQKRRMARIAPFDRAMLTQQLDHPFLGRRQQRVVICTGQIYRWNVGQIVRRQVLIESEEALRLKLLDVGARGFWREVVIEAGGGVCWDRNYVLR